MKNEHASTVAESINGLIFQEGSLVISLKIRCVNIFLNWGVYEGYIYIRAERWT